MCVCQRPGEQGNPGVKRVDWLPKTHYWRCPWCICLCVSIGLNISNWSGAVDLEGVCKSRKWGDLGIQGPVVGYTERVRWATWWIHVYVFATNRLCSCSAREVQDEAINTACNGVIAVFSVSVELCGQTHVEMCYVYVCTQAYWEWHAQPQSSVVLGTWNCDSFISIGLSNLAAPDWL